MKRFFLLNFLLAPAICGAAIHTEKVSYKQGNATLVGYLAYDDAVKDKRPGVLVIHEWWGLNDTTKQHTEEIAKLGYVAFAPDIYGDGKTTSDPAEAAKISGIYKSDRGLMRGRANAGLKVLRSQPLVDGKKLAAIGFCFGGTTALELARAGADTKGTVCFHGGLDTPNTADAKNIHGKVLVLTGGDDNYVPIEQIKTFEEEMRNAKVDWQVFAYGGAVHGFTNPSAGTDNSKGYAYNAKVTQRAWEAMTSFFNEIFSSPR